MVATFKWLPKRSCKTAHLHLGICTIEPSSQLLSNKHPFPPHDTWCVLEFKFPREILSPRTTSPPSWETRIIDDLKSARVRLNRLERCTSWTKLDYRLIGGGDRGQRGSMFWQSRYRMIQSTYAQVDYPLHETRVR